MTEAIAAIPPGAILILGGLLTPLWRGRTQPVYLVAVALASLWHLTTLHGLDGAVHTLTVFGYDLVPVRVDALSLVFGTIFHIAVLLGVVYALHVRDTLQHVAALVYAGSAVGAVFAGDVITLFVYWELTAIASVFLIWARRTPRAYRAGMRYLIVQVGSGVLLLSGVIFRYRDTGSLDFSHIGLGTLGNDLIFLAFGIKAAFPLLHNWLQDAYPEATPTGTVFLSAFTTKLAIYALARSFAGTEILVYLGAIMTAFPIFYAVIENDLRRVLAYSLNNQLGFMVVGVGIGTELALNGTASHAFAHILYKALLFMSMGAVLHRTGTALGSELGGLYKSMPWTTAFCIVGAASISAFPFTNGFISKSLIVSASAEEHFTVVFFVLLFASAGVFHHSGIKIPFFAFFAHDSGIRCKEAPPNMLIAMGVTALLCLGIGIFPGPLYSILPYPVHYEPYTVTHVITQYQLLIWSALAFTFLKLTKLYPPELRSTVLDSDWFYRRLYPAVALGLGRTVAAADGALRGAVLSVLERGRGWLRATYGPASPVARTSATGSEVMWLTVILGAFLIIYLL